MPEIVISDTSCLIVLSKIGKLSEIKPLIEQIMQTDFRLSQAIIRQALIDAGEEL